MNQKAIVIEINEVPLKLLNHYQKVKPKSNIGFLLSNSLVLETKAEDVEESFLYPSQTWGSVNTGASYDLHKIHWYNDPKPDSYPLYWKKVAEGGHKVGLINTLHSSPADSYIEDSNYKFVIPDCFASDNLTKPDIYQDFQALNTSATSGNGRAVTMSFPRQKAVSTLVKSPLLGIKSKTLFDAAGLVARVKAGRVNKERIRNLQFTLLADIFFKQLEKNDVDLAIFFTNHIAANMHRYWYSLFPDEYELNLYDQAWVDKYSSEIVVALDLLDSFLGKLIAISRSQGRALILLSSMGQAANEELTSTPKYHYILRDFDKLLNKLSPNRQYTYQVDAAMVPQYSLNFDSAVEAADCFAVVRDTKQDIDGMRLEVDLNQETVTISTYLDSDAANSGYFGVKGQSYSYDELGYEQIPIDEHHAARHCPEGTLIVYNSETSHADTDTVNYLEYAPAMLEFFGLEASDYMLKPQFKI